ncbi:PLP-dependent aminotransferase family protein [Paenibacillus alvei]|uniref:PLP-dependent aminotransferase family protein n=1 Tax=Paenibacillus alvei TaxID=44250 RepID=A0ABT4H2C9_PAEAL|nr:PLP-dependent aminotransferase family protein [Paenibacillus alvei]MCY9756522.1 PLP-dependent aminotransferase family protein [Paenibacillus alvei]MCY9763113.1 PLP-dependent aminotransferase family protein [Paenibacillus alvei]MCY9766017.1 PLP-dependent aminotransferase family protein [Paenibacillus alvei]
MWKPDRSSKQPLYQQIAAYIERSIYNGEFSPGSILPSERKFAEQIHVNRSTVVQAYEELRAAGIIESMVGSGTRVSKSMWGTGSQQTPDWHQYLDGCKVVQPDPLYSQIIRSALDSGSSCIDFASGELSPDLSPNEEMRMLLSEHPLHEDMSYDHSQGYMPLREVLSSFLHHYRGIRTTESSILVTSGSHQSLYLITHRLLQPGDAIAIEDPSYYNSLPMFHAAGLRLFRLPVDEKGICPDGILSLYRENNIRMIFVNPNYHNPTGRVLDPSRREQLLEICGSLGIPIVEDDPFSLTSFTGNPPPTLKSLDTNNTVIYIGSLSKIVASGLRIGWMVAPQSVITRLAAERQQIDFGMSVLPQRIAARLLSEAYFDQHLVRLRQELLKKRNLLIDALQRELPGEVAYSLPQGGLHLWCKVNPPFHDTLLLEESVKQGVLYYPGTVYGSKAGYVRFTYARPHEDEIDLGIARFAQALKASRQRMK